MEKKEEASPKRLIADEKSRKETLELIELFIISNNQALAILSQT